MRLLSALLQIQKVWEGKGEWKELGMEREWWGKRKEGERKGEEGKGSGIYIRFGERNEEEEWKGLEMEME